ncbi:MAG TPA: sporulation histidine kinase inhibitor Sda [Virgibacillus sp.]|nr:sporulation histidine kinase inhibitor Sda [Virgibacillus sp.]
MNRLSEQMLMEAYKKSVQLNLDTRFIQLLYHEIERRKSSNKKV